MTEPGETRRKACGTETSEQRPLLLRLDCACNGPGIVWAKGPTGRQEAGHRGL